jgi:hypothetical protein
VCAARRLLLQHLLAGTSMYSGGEGELAEIAYRVAVDGAKVALREGLEDASVQLPRGERIPAGGVDLCGRFMFCAQTTPSLAFPD